MSDDRNGERDFPAPDVTASFRRLTQAFLGPDPLPAGGAAGITALASGIAVGAKVLRLSQPDAPEIAVLAALVHDLEAEFTADCTAFAELLAALALPRDADGRRTRIAAGWRAATEAPVRVASIAAQAARALDAVAEQIKPAVRGDLAAAQRLIDSGSDIAVANARENARHLEPAVADELLAGLASRGPS